MQVFEIAPPSGRPLWILIAVVLIILAVLTALVVSLLGARLARFEVSAGGLRLRGDWYGRFIPAEVVVADGAHRVDLAAVPGLRPVRRPLGTGLPGYQAGWFRLANGERALLYLTDRTKAVYVPTTAGYGLLLSPNDPEGFLSAPRSTRRR